MELTRQKSQNESEIPEVETSCCKPRLPLMVSTRISTCSSDLHRPCVTNSIRLNSIFEVLVTSNRQGGLFRALVL